MGEKDIAEKVLEDYDDVFADIVNVLLFGGERIVKEEELESTKDMSQYKADGRLHELERDVTKLWRKNRIRIALFGMENQTDIDGDMVLRVLGYEGASYRQQLLKEENRREAVEDTRPERYPVITLVLYFGTRHWKERTLFERLEIPEELRPFVNDYRINVFEIAYLSGEQIALFQSDFKIVADYFVQMRKNQSYIPSTETIRHVDEIFKMMAVLAGDIDFAGEWNQRIIEKGGKRDMATMRGFFDEAIEKGIGIGKAEGIGIGIGQGDQCRLISMVYKKMLKGQSPEVIAEDLVEELPEIRRIYDAIEESLPEFDATEVYKKLKNSVEIV